MFLGQQATAVATGEAWDLIASQGAPLRCVNLVEEPYFGAISGDFARKDRPCTARNPADTGIFVFRPLFLTTTKFWHEELAEGACDGLMGGPFSVLLAGGKCTGVAFVGSPGYACVAKMVPNPPPPVKATRVSVWRRRNSGIGHRTCPVHL